MSDFISILVQTFTRIDVVIMLSFCFGMITMNEIHAYVLKNKYHKKMMLRKYKGKPTEWYFKDV